MKLSNLENDAGGQSPARIAEGPANARAVHGVIRDGLTRTCHDCSEGGLAVALAEMSMGGRLGCDVSLQGLASNAEGLTSIEAAFSETNSRYLLEVEPGNLERVLEALDGCAVTRLGTTGGEMVTIKGTCGEDFISVGTEALRMSHQVHPG